MQICISLNFYLCPFLEQQVNKNISYDFTLYIAIKLHYCKDISAWNIVFNFGRGFATKSPCLRRFLHTLEVSIYMYKLVMKIWIHKGYSSYKLVMKIWNKNRYLNIMTWHIPLHFDNIFYMHWFIFPYNEQ